MDLNMEREAAYLDVAAGIEAIRSVSRIAVIGPCGAGKSTLARELGELTGLPVTHIDRLHWKPGWVEGSPEELRAVLSEVVAQDQWIIDGNYGATFDIRMPRAELVIYLDFPRRIYFRRVITRVAKNYGRVRADLAPGCPERLDLEFLRFVWRIPKVSRPRTLARIEEFNVARRTLRLQSPREVGRVMEKLRIEKARNRTLPS